MTLPFAALGILGQKFSFHRMMTSEEGMARGLRVPLTSTRIESGGSSTEHPMLMQFFLWLRLSTVERKG